MTLEQALLKANEVYWVRYVVKDNDGEYIGYSHLPENVQYVSLGGQEQKIKQHIKLKNVSNTGKMLSTRILYLFYTLKLDTTVIVKQIRSEGIYSAIQYYRMFGHDGTLDDIFLDSSFFYMLEYPQVYFSAYDKNKSRSFKSKVYNESIKLEYLNDLKVGKYTPIFSNGNGGFMISSKSMPFLAAFERQMYTLDEKTMEKYNQRKEVR